MKTYPIEIVLSLTTGRMLKVGGFNEMHELAEHVLGHPVWTHEFADIGTVHRMAEAIFAQHPQLRDAETFDGMPRQGIDKYIEDCIERATATFGATLDIEPGSQERTETPMASAQRLMPDKPVVIVVLEEK